MNLQDDPKFKSIVSDPEFISLDPVSQEAILNHVFGNSNINNQQNIDNSNQLSWNQGYKNDPNPETNNYGILKQPSNISEIAANKGYELGQKMKEDPGYIMSAIGGAIKGVSNIGTGAARLISMLTGDEDSENTYIDQAKTAKNLMGPIEEKYPKTSFIGEIAGESALMPLGGVGKNFVRKAITSIPIGGLTGAISEAGRGKSNKEIATGTFLGSALGPFGEAAGYIINKTGRLGINKVIDLLKKSKKPLSSFIDSNGNLTQSALSELDKINISKDEFIDAFKDLPKEYLDKLKQLEPAQAYRQARFQNATGGQLTHAQSAKDLAAQIEEKTLAMGRSKESTEALSILDKQREDILKAKSKFLKELGGEIDQTKSSLGLSLRTTLEELKSTDKQYTRKLYKGFRNLPNLNMKMDGDLFAESANAAAYNTNASPQFRGSLKKLLRDFNIIQSTKPSPYPKGDFTINNADRIINEINKLPINKTYEGSDIAAKQMIKENFESMFEITARDSDIKAVQELEKEARSSAWQNRLKWNDRDILTDLLKYKNGTQSYVIPESDILNTIYRGGDKKLEKIKKIKNVLMINPTSKSEEVWKNIKTQGTLDIFSKSIFKSAEGKTYISGNDLNKAIEEFGEEPLKALLDRNEYRVLKQLQNAIGDATIDVDGKQLKKGMPKVIDLLAKLTFLQSVPLLYKGAHLLNNSIDSAISYMDKSTILNGMKNGYRNLPAKDAAKLYIDFAIQNSLLRGGIQTGQYLSEDQQ